ncbi:MAG TPA: hypothetical protein VNK41_09410 [Vicinamibacterales bacterium]|nr:hypothetical protein [Vicinamibacterales bacterium]
MTHVAGPSWLKELNLRLTDTTLGRAGAHHGPLPGAPAPPPEPKLRMSEPVTLTDADLLQSTSRTVSRMNVESGIPPSRRTATALGSGCT